MTKADRVDEAHRHPCTQCGADLRFQPGQTQLVCDHCGHVQEIATPAPRQKARALGEIALARGLAQDLGDDISEEVRATSCPNCGAVIEFQGANHAQDCPFCATPVVVDTGTYRHIKPQAVLPFEISENQARAALTRWLGSLWFAPNRLLDYTRKGRAMAGIYVPFWTFDAATTSRYSGQRGEHYYETRTVTVNVNGRSEQRQEQVRHTRWYPASGQVARDFDDLLVMASTSLPPRLGAELTPWDLTRLQPYSPEFLAGFQAEGYTVALADANQSARAQMARVIERDVRRAIGGDEQRISAIDTRHSDETFKHILLPVWTAAYKYNGKSYRFVVNGQTAEVQGERPYSWWKIVFAVLAVVVVAGAALVLSDPSAFGINPSDLPDWLN